MPVFYQSNILRFDLRTNRDVLFLFGDNELRKGFGGQAREMRGEPNACGIRTKKAPDMHQGSFWTDAQYERNVCMILEDLQRPIAHLRNGGIVVIPTSGIGTGYARLVEFAPRTLAFLNDSIARLSQVAMETNTHAATKLSAKRQPEFVLS